MNDAQTIARPLAHDVSDVRGLEVRSIAKSYDKRAVLHPRWVVENRGPSRFRTDAYGSRSPAGFLQVVSRRLRVDQSDECCGAENAFIMERPSDGGIYRAGRGLNSANFEFPGYCVLRTN